MTGRYFQHQPPDLPKGEGARITIPHGYIYIEMDLAAFESEEVNLTTGLGPELLAVYDTPRANSTQFWQPFNVNNIHCDVCFVKDIVKDRIIPCGAGQCLSGRHVRCSRSASIMTSYFCALHSR